MTKEKYLATKNSTENATFEQKTVGISIFSRLRQGFIRHIALAL